METRVCDGPKELDMLSWMGRTALELVGQAGLGWSFDPLVADAPDNHLGAAVKLIVYVCSPSIITFRGLTKLRA